MFLFLKFLILFLLSSIVVSKPFKPEDLGYQILTLKPNSIENLLSVDNKSGSEVQKSFINDGQKIEASNKKSGKKQKNNRTESEIKGITTHHNISKLSTQNNTAQSKKQSAQNNEKKIRTKPISESTSFNSTIRLNDNKDDSNAKKPATIFQNSSVTNTSEIIDNKNLTKQNNDEINQTKLEYNKGKLNDTDGIVVSNSHSNSKGNKSLDLTKLGTNQTTINISNSTNQKTINIFNSTNQTESVDKLILKGSKNLNFTLSTSNSTLNSNVTNLSSNVTMSSNSSQVTNQLDKNKKPYFRSLDNANLDYSDHNMQNVFINERENYFRARNLETHNRHSNNLIDFLTWICIAAFGFIIGIFIGLLAFTNN